MRYIVLMFFTLSISFACLCTPLIQMNVEMIKAEIIDGSLDPYKESIDKSVDALKDEQKRIEKEIEKIKEDMHTQQQKTKNIKLLIEKIKEQNELILDQIKMESI